MSDPIDPSKPTWTDPAPTTVGPTPSAPVTTPPAGAAPGGFVAPVAPVGPVVPVTPAPPIATGPAPAAAAPARKSSGVWVNLLLGAAAIIAVGGVAFAIGRSTAPAAAANVVTLPGGGTGVFVGPGGSFAPGNGNGQGGFRGPGALFGAGGLAVEGTVQSIDGSTMTVKTANGETLTVALDGSTTYHKATTATASDVATGDSVTVRVSGGRFGADANGGAGVNGGTGGTGGSGGTTTPRFTASDVTVTP